MYSKGVVQAWLGAAIARASPKAAIYGGTRNPDMALDDLRRRGVSRVALFECVGSVRMTRFARSSRVNKYQVAEYATDAAFAPWRSRTWFVFGHPHRDCPLLPVEDAISYLVCIGLEDLRRHIELTGRGTINSDLLEALLSQPSLDRLRCVATPLEDVLRDIAFGEATTNHVSQALPASNERFRGYFGWVTRPSPLFVELEPMQHG